MQTTLTEHKNVSDDEPTDDTPDLPDGLPWSSWADTPDVVKRHIRHSDGNVHDGIGDLFREEVGE